MKNMLRPQSKSRLLSKRERTKTFFKTVVKSGGLFSTKDLSLKIIKGESLKSEVRVVVSKKTIPSAVFRNRLKRRIRSIFKEARPQSLQAIFYAKAGISELSFKELRKEVICLIERCKL